MDVVLAEKTVPDAGERAINLRLQIPHSQITSHFGFSAAAESENTRVKFPFTARAIYSTYSWSSLKP